MKCLFFLLLTNTHTLSLSLPLCSRTTKQPGCAFVVAIPSFLRLPFIFYIYREIRLLTPSPSPSLRIPNVPTDFPPFFFSFRC